MRERFLIPLLLTLVSASGCLNFDGLLANGCASDAAWAECRGDTDGGPRPDAGAPDDGGCGEMLGNGTWCWENPGPFGAPDLFTVWGTSDTDVWVGGSGGALLHFDGTRWSQSPVSLTPNLMPFRPEPVARSVAIDDAGVVWMVGEEMQVLAFASDGGLLGRHGVVTNRIVASSFGGTTWTLSPGGSMVELGQVNVGGTPSFPTKNLPGGDNSVALVAGTGGVFIGYERVSPQGAAVLNVSTDLVQPLETPSTTEVRNLRSFSRRDGVPMLATTAGDLFERADGGWAWRGGYSLGEDVRSHAFDTLADGGFRWWVTGAAGTVASLEDFDAGLVTRLMGGGSAAFGSWVSPTGHLWAAGLDGYVVEVALENGSPVVSARGATNEVNLLDVAVRGDLAVAAGRGGVLFTRDTRTKRWSGQQNQRADDYRGVAVGPGDEVCTLDLNGRIACNGLEVQADELRLGDGGFIPTGDRGGAIALRADGGAVAALGDIVLVRSGDTWQRFDAGLTTPHINDLVLTPNGFAVVANELNSNNEVVNGRLVIFEGTTRNECRTGAGGLAGVAKSMNGFAVVGPGVVGECSATGTFSNITTPDSVWTSVWVDASGGWWVLDNSGTVLRRPPTGGTWQRERLPVSGSSYDGPSAQRITGDDNEVFVVCKQGGVLRRRLP